MPDGANATVTIDGVQYDAVGGPDAASNEVERARSEVLQKLDLHQILRNLERTNDLLYIAACGVAGAKDTSLSAKVAKL